MAATRHDAFLRRFAVILVTLVVGSPLHAAGGEGLSGALGRSGVIRFTDQVGFFIIDQSSGLMSMHGTAVTFAQLCSGTPITIDPLTIQAVRTPSGGIHALFSGEEHKVLVYMAPAVPDPHHPGPEDCPILASLPVVASGTARLVRTDNDITLAGPGADAFGWSATGTLKDMATGGYFHYSETVRALVRPHADGDEIVSLQTAIRLVPIPSK